jgi:hypothetical protein
MSENRLLRYFKYEHLPPYLQEISRPFCELAREIAAKEAADPAEQTAGLRKLLEAKDCIVRAMLPLLLVCMLLATGCAVRHNSITGETEVGPATGTSTSTATGSSTSSNREPWYAAASAAYAAGESAWYDWTTAERRASADRLRAKQDARQGVIDRAAAQGVQ